MESLRTIVDLASITIVPSYNCHSANCVGCYEKSDPAYVSHCNSLIDIDALTAFLRRYLSIARCRWFGIIGGEVTDYPYCSKLIATLSSEFPGVPIVIVTNGQNPDSVLSILDATGHRKNLSFELSIDGYGSTCDLLRGRFGYFRRAIETLDVLVRCGYGADIHINARYFQNHEDSLLSLTKYLKRRFGIDRKQFSLCGVTQFCLAEKAGSAYIRSLRAFSERFWGDDPPCPTPRSHSQYLRYVRSIPASFAFPAVQPDGRITTCDKLHAATVGHIGDEDVAAIIDKLLLTAARTPSQCDNCGFGVSAWLNYLLANENKHGGAK